MVCLTRRLQATQGSQAKYQATTPPRPSISAPTGPAEPHPDLSAVVLTPQSIFLPVCFRATGGAREQVPFHSVTAVSSLPWPVVLEPELGTGQRWGPVEGAQCGFVRRILSASRPGSAPGHQGGDSHGPHHPKKEGPAHKSATWPVGGLQAARLQQSWSFLLSPGLACPTPPC